MLDSICTLNYDIVCGQDQKMDEYKGLKKMYLESSCLAMRE